MIFLDETGKRWRRIKRSLGLLGSTLALPTGIIIIAALFYLPAWGSISLPKPVFTEDSSALEPEPDISSVLSSQTPENQPATSSTRRKSTSTPSSSVESDTNQTQPDTTTPADNNASTPQETSPEIQPLPTPDPINQDLVSPGNSEYGQNHKPTRS